MDKNLIGEIMKSASITVQGDLVMEKHVEHEIGNVEAGGIGCLLYTSPSPRD